uniref:Uncharacterized protein n=1 Tax=Cacopsylla melanoneura TaxID=428564 RepID=A0A8D8ZN92_9HEMI
MSVKESVSLRATTVTVKECVCFFLSVCRPLIEILLGMVGGAGRSLKVSVSCELVIQSAPRGGEVTGRGGWEQGAARVFPVQVVYHGFVVGLANVVVTFIDLGSWPR